MKWLRMFPIRLERRNAGTGIIVTCFNMRNKETENRQERYKNSCRRMVRLEQSRLKENLDYYKTLTKAELLGRDGRTKC